MEQLSFGITAPFLLSFSMIQYLKMHFQKGAAADGRTEEKEARPQGKETEVQVSLGLGHPPKANR